MSGKDRIIAWLKTRSEARAKDRRAIADAMVVDMPDLVRQIQEQDMPNAVITGFMVRKYKEFQSNSDGRITFKNNGGYHFKQLFDVILKGGDDYKVLTEVITAAESKKASEPEEPPDEPQSEPQSEAGESDYDTADDAGEPSTEHHWPGYNFMGQGTDVPGRLINPDPPDKGIPKNYMDWMSLKHDIMYFGDPQARLRADAQFIKDLNRSFKDQRVTDLALTRAAQGIIKGKSVVSSAAGGDTPVTDKWLKRLYKTYTNYLVTMGYSIDVNTGDLNYDELNELPTSALQFKKYYTEILGQMKTIQENKEPDIGDGPNLHGYDIFGDGDYSDDDGDEGDEGDDDGDEGDDGDDGDEVELKEEKEGKEGDDVDGEPDATVPAGVLPAAKVEPTQPPSEEPEPEEEGVPEIIDRTPIDASVITSLRPQLKQAGSKKFETTKKQDSTSDKVKMYEFVLKNTEYVDRFNSLVVENQRNQAIRFNKANALVYDETNASMRENLGVRQVKRVDFKKKTKKQAYHNSIKGQPRVVSVLTPVAKFSSAKPVVMRGINDFV